MREKLAALMHEIWGIWTNHIFQQSSWDRESDSLIIPGHLVERWSRQMGTCYDALSEKEKDSDRREADKVLALFEKRRERTLAAVEDAGYAMVGGSEEPVPVAVISAWLVSIEETL